MGSPDDAGGENRVDSPGVQPVVRPDGTLLVLYFNETRVSLIRSTDGGATLAQAVRRAGGGSRRRTSARSRCRSRTSGRPGRSTSRGWTAGGGTTATRRRGPAARHVGRRRELVRPGPDRDGPGDRGHLLRAAGPGGEPGAAPTAGRGVLPPPRRGDRRVLRLLERRRRRLVGAATPEPAVDVSVPGCRTPSTGRCSPTTSRRRTSTAARSRSSSSPAGLGARDLQQSVFAALVR